MVKPSVPHRLQRTQMPYLWNDDQSVDELKHKLVRANLELQCMESEAREEIRKDKETIRQLVEVLENVCRERDEARNKLAKAVEMEADILDKLVMAKPLPEKGKLMRAVAEAGPLLQSLLPKWQHPPPPPPLPLLVGESSGSRVFSQIPSSSVLNFGRACLNG